MDKALKQKIKTNNALKEKNTLSKYACLSEQGIRRIPEDNDEDIRSKFSRDADRIIHSMAYTRYIDKTQVFYLVDNDHITHRVLHVQLVSKIAREIGRELSLNEDLIEAIALGHDIGHTPFGHEGEDYLSQISIQHNQKPFKHNVQSVRFLQNIEKRGKGLNLTLQVVDGILCHNGEIVQNKLVPDWRKDWAKHDEELSRQDKKIVPMTLEGCVVRFSDIFAYIGRDIEDAIKVGLMKRNDLPNEITKVLGKYNKDIVNALVIDLVENSFDKDYIGLSENIFQALFKLKDFNYKNIYKNPKIKTESHKIKNMFDKLFNLFLTDLKNENKDSLIYKNFLITKNDSYLKETHDVIKVRDFIAGMTNAYLIKAFKNLFIPNNYGEKFE